MNAFEKETENHFEIIDEEINTLKNQLEQNISRFKKETDEFQQETQSNFKKINEKIDKLEKIKQIKEQLEKENKSIQESE